ncbi:MAG: type III PLP-dependent enzyme [Chloroflexota bacterium]|nr:type III PLP-dependent enzyme [Chloroflexota bacterium]
MRTDKNHLLTDDIETPTLVLDLAHVRENLEAVRAAFAQVNPRILYSCKANSDADVLRTVYEAGCGFDVASIGEIRQLEAVNIPARAAVFSSTVKIGSHISDAFARGIDTFAFDSYTEVEKLAERAPGAKVIVRLEVPHVGSRWPLAHKFGVPPLEAVDLLRQAEARGLHPYGLTFHVGSQCERPQSWGDAIEVAGRVWTRARDAGIRLKLVNFGGGIPAKYTEPVPHVVDIGKEVTSRISREFGWDAEYAIEPGRFVTAEAGTLVTTVIGTATRNHKPWVFVDLSIYAGLLEVTGGWRYPMVTSKDHLPKRPTTLAGPTCDSTDLLASDIDLPELQVGDRLLLGSAGAYTTSYREYNGFTFPQVIAIPDSAAASEAA